MSGGTKLPGQKGYPDKCAPGQKSPAIWYPAIKSPAQCRCIYDVYQRLMKIKKTKSTLPIDIPDKVRQECAVLLAEPVTAIINNSLSQSVYPSIWKQEWVTQAPKVTHPQSFEDLRKISCTSDYIS